MKRRPLEFWHEGWKKIMTTCMRCGKKVRNATIVKGDKKCFYSLCRDCCFSLDYHGSEKGFLTNKEIIRKIFMKKFMDDISRREWDIQIKKKKTMVDILEILDFSKADMKKLFPEIVGESL